MRWDHKVFSFVSHFFLITGDFNAISTNYFINDAKTSEGAQWDSLMTLFGLKQLTTEPIHILDNSCSYIDLISINKRNIVTGSGIHATLHWKWHQMFYSKFKSWISSSIYSWYVKLGIITKLTLIQLITLFKASWECYVCNKTITQIKTLIKIKN